MAAGTMGVWYMGAELRNLVHYVVTVVQDLLKLVFVDLPFQGSAPVTDPAS